MKEKHLAGGIIINDNGDILVIEQNHNSWAFPKGCAEQGEDFFQTALREIHEETGIMDLTMVKILDTFQRKNINKKGEFDDPTYRLNSYHYYLFSTHQNEVQPNDPDNEITAWRWLPRDHVVGLLTHPKDKEFFQSIIHTI